MPSFDCPIIINVRDRLAPLQALIAWLEKAGHERITLLDNDSSFPPLLDYLAATPYDVVCLGRNVGSRAIWEAGLVPDDFFVYTDPDIVPTDDCPLDAVARLRELLDRYPAFDKAGLGLYLDDVPATFRHMEWERSLVEPQRQIGPGVFDSLVDTTFALYRPGGTFLYRALRTGAPYQARHLSPSWYGGELSEEDRFYLARARRDDCYGSTWARDARSENS